MLWLTVHPSILPPLGKGCVNHSQTTHAWRQDIVPGDDTKIQQNSGGRHVSVCSWVDDWVGWRVERVHCLKGNIRPKMKRGSWKWWVAPSAVTGVNSTVIVLAGRELPTQPPTPILCCVVLGQMTSFWQDYPKPGSNLYSTHNGFLQYDKENKQQNRRPDPGVPRKRRPWCCVDHSWQILSHQSNTRVKMWLHYSITWRLFTNTKRWTPSEDHAQNWQIMGCYCWRHFYFNW